FLAATGHLPPPHWPRGRALAQHPVVEVSFGDALAYARWAGKALPTGQQWEKAARGNRGDVFPWGDEFSADRCNVHESRIKTTTAVTRYDADASPYGAVDLCGNVWEWCATVDAIGRWQTRGGSFRSAVHLASPSRSHRRPATASRDDLGFRCATTLE